MFRIIEWPALRAAIPGIAGVVLMLCFTSFAIVLTLGGGPKATTLEVAIFQALRFDFDLPRAVFLALIQMLLCGTVAGALLSFGRMPEILPGGQTATTRPRPASRVSLLIDSTVLVLALMLVLPPLAAILLEGLRGGLMTVLQDGGLWSAMATSLSIALAAGLIATVTGLALLISSRHLRLRFGRDRLGQGMELAGSIVLVVPPFVLVTGLFLLLRGVTDVFGKAQLLVVLVNACMALPFAIRVIGPACLQSGLAHDRLCQSLALKGFNRLRLVDWPALRRPGGLALAYATTLSLGDFGVVAIFGSQDFTTLPLFIYRLMGAYKLGEAAAASLVLILLCFMIFVVIERLVGGRDARN